MKCYTVNTFLLPPLGVLGLAAGVEAFSDLGDFALGEADPGVLAGDLAGDATLGDLPVDFVLGEADLGDFEGVAVLGILAGDAAGVAALGDFLGDFAFGDVDLPRNFAFGGVAALAG